MLILVLALLAALAASHPTPASPATRTPDDAVAAQMAAQMATQMAAPPAQAGGMRLMDMPSH